MMRSWLAIGTLLVGINASGLAQQNGTFKVKPTPPEKPAKQSAPIGKTGSATSASAANAKALKNTENLSGKGLGAAKTPAQKPATLKPVKDKPNPPINFSGASGGKGTGAAHQGSDPYRGRLRQKHAGSSH
jgi:hypothetical protein